MNLFENYISNTWLETEIKLLPIDIQSKFLRLLKKEKDKQNFLSHLSELKFGIILRQISTELTHEKKIDLLTPDWQISNQKENSIFEVYRLGKSNKDSNLDDLYSFIDSKISNLEYNIYVQILVNDNLLDYSIQETAQYIPDVHKWLNENQLNLYSNKIFGDIFELEIVKINTAKSHILCTLGPRIIDQKPQKLEKVDGLKDNEITKKLKKYTDIVSKYSLPYFLCVDIDFVSGFHFSDFKEHFLSKSTEFADYETDRIHMPNWGKEWSALGEFYNQGTKEILSGIIVIENNQVKVLLNPNRNQIIYSDQYKSLLQKIKSLDNYKLFDLNIPKDVLKMIEDINSQLKQ